MNKWIIGSLVALGSFVLGLSAGVWYICHYSIKAVEMAPYGVVEDRSGLIPYKDGLHK